MQCNAVLSSASSFSSPNPHVYYCKTSFKSFRHLPSIQLNPNPNLSASVSGSSRKILGFSCRKPSESPYSNSYLSEEDFDVELGRFLALLPEEMRQRIIEYPELRHLIEVIMDLGRKPLARFPSGEFVFSDHPITMEDLDHATSQVWGFGIDNRAGISRSLHRISDVRNRKGAIVGLTCRVGRPVSGSASLLRALVKALLLIGPPGIGKTTIFGV